MIVQNFDGKTLERQNVGKFTIATCNILATLVNLEFGWVKYWQMVFSLPNSLFSPTKILLCIVFMIVHYIKSLYINSFISCFYEDDLQKLFTPFTQLILHSLYIILLGLKQILNSFVYLLGYTSIRIPREYLDIHV